jgi:hypothetical protein
MLKINWRSVKLFVKRFLLNNTIFFKFTLNNFLFIILIFLVNFQMNLQFFRKLLLIYHYKIFFFLIF